MGLIDFFKISAPSVEKVSADKIRSRYNYWKNTSFWASFVAYCCYYFCRTAISVLKQPLIDEKVLSVDTLAIIGFAISISYAVGKFLNGFIADYANIKRFMAVGLFFTALINLLYGYILDINIFSTAITSVFLIALWALNGIFQSMGAPTGVISISRWYPQSQRASYFSLFSSSPYVGRFLAALVISQSAIYFGWHFGFISASLVAFVGVLIILVFVHDNPESKGLPTIQELSGEDIKTRANTKQIQKLQKSVLLHPGMWVIAIFSAFVYIVQGGISSWGILFLQKQKAFNLEQASIIIPLAESFGLVGTLFAGWLSDKIFKGNRFIPFISCGIIAVMTLLLFLYTKGDLWLNIAYIAVFSLVMGVLYFVVAGKMAIDIVPRESIGAALGIVGISSYIAVGIQEIISGRLIQINEIANKSTISNYDFMPVAMFWLVSCVICVLVPVLFWKTLKRPIRLKDIEE